MVGLGERRSKVEQQQCSEEDLPITKNNMEALFIMRLTRKFDLRLQFIGKFKHPNMIGVLDLVWKVYHDMTDAGANIIFTIGGYKLGVQNSIPWSRRMEIGQNCVVDNITRTRAASLSLSYNPVLFNFLWAFYQKKGSSRWLLAWISTISEYVIGWLCSVGLTDICASPLWSNRFDSVGTSRSSLDIVE